MVESAPWWMRGMMSAMYRRRAADVEGAPSAHTLLHRACSTALWAVLCSHALSAQHALPLCLGLRFQPQQAAADQGSGALRTAWGQRWYRPLTAFGGCERCRCLRQSTAGTTRVHT